MLPVKYTKLALKDLDDAYEYIFKDNPVAAQEVISKIRTTIYKLAEFPYLGHSGRVAGTFEFTILGTPFIIIYMVDDALKIVSILHSSRKYPC